MLGKLLKLRHNEFVRHNAVFFVGSMVVAGTNYLYYPVVGRLLSTPDFGEVQALVSIFLQVALLLNVIANVTVNIVANSNDNIGRSRIVLEFGRFATLIMAVVVALALLFSEPLKHFLHLDDILPLSLLGLALVLGSLATMRMAYLRGVNAYGRLSVASFITAIVKLLASLLLVLVGLHTGGAIGGLVAAEVATVLYVNRTAKKLGLHQPKGEKWYQLPDMRLIRPELPYAGLVLIVSVVTTVFFSIDVVLAKHFFSPQLAGEYAGIATIGRIIYFVTGSVATVLLSSIKLQRSIKENRQVFLRSLLLTALLGGGVLLVFTLFPRFFIHLLIGQRYLPLAHLLPKLSLTLFLISIINLVFSYDVALRRWSIAVISVIGAGATIVLVGLDHATPAAMISSLLAGALFLLALRGLDSLRRNVLHWGPNARPT